VVSILPVASYVAKRRPLVITDLIDELMLPKIRRDVAVAADCW
jgi:hypothetical protein